MVDCIGCKKILKRLGRLEKREVINTGEMIDKEHVSKFNENNDPVAFCGFLAKRDDQSG